MPKEFSRTRRVAEQLRRDLAALMRVRLDDPRMAMVSITAIVVSRDLRHARVYVTVVGAAHDKRTEIVAHLNGVSGYLRGELGRKLRLRSTPQLRFLYDESVERGAELSALIESARSHDEAARGSSQNNEDDELSESP